MEITRFIQSTDNAVRFSRQQASDFAKSIAGDFNPIHDPDNKRFCVPGDLLFAVLLHRYGAYSDTHLQFAGMVTDQSTLQLPAAIDGPLYLADERDRDCLTLITGGDVTQDAVFIGELTRHYVQFSGKTFPDILVELMRDAGVMINPMRPLVIYKDMTFHLNCFNSNALSLSLADADLSVTGKKGLARLSFSIQAEGDVIGHGEKNMVLSGLREFDEGAMSDVISQYNQWKIAYREVSDAM